MKKSELLQLLLNVTNVAIAARNIEGYVKATENKEGRDISDILSKRIFKAGPFESIAQLDRVKGIGPLIMLNMAEGVFVNGASLNNTEELNPEFVTSFLLPQDEGLSESSKLFFNLANDSDFFPNEFPELALINEEDANDSQVNFEVLANNVQEMAISMLNPNCSDLTSRLNDIAVASNKGGGLDPIFNRIAQEFTDAAKRNKEEDSLDKESARSKKAVDFSELKLLLSIDNPEAKLPNISSDKKENLNKLRIETAKAIGNITSIEALFNRADSTAVATFSITLLNTESELAALNQVLIEQYRCQLITAEITKLGSNMLTIAALLEMLAPTFGVFYAFGGIFDNCKKVGVSSCEMISFKAYAVQRILSRIVPATGTSGRLKLGDGVINTLVKSIEDFLKDGKIPDSLKKAIGDLLSGKEFSDLVAAFVAGKIGIKILTKFLEKRLAALFATAGVKLAAAAGIVTLSVLLFSFSVAIAHMAIAAFTKNIKGFVLFCATFKVTACVKNIFGVKRKVTYMINLKIRPKDAHGIRFASLRDLMFHAEDLGVTASSILEVGGYIELLADLNKKLSATKNTAEKASLKLQIKNVDAAIKKLTKAKKKYDEIRGLAAKKGCQAISKSINVLPKVIGFEKCS